MARPHPNATRPRPAATQRGLTSYLSYSSWVGMSIAAFLAVLLGLFYRAVSSGSNGAAHVSQATVERAIVTCRQLQDHLGSSLIVLPSTPEYTELREENWSHTAWRYPSCIARPTVTTEIALLVKNLVDNRVPFAIRSGGHSPNPFDSNIDTGVLISLDNFDEVSYHAGTGLVTLGPGARWEAVYTELDKYNRTMVGGRVLNVGVGGLTLGSGLSYLSDLYGMVCDNVVSYEVVLADGRIVEASTTSNPDLFWALKGGTNNFGIVTKFNAKTYPLGQGWGGIQVYASDQVPALLQALHEYQTTPNKDPYANMIINLLPTNGTMLLTLIYLKPVERPAAYAAFYALTPVFEQTGFMTLHQLQALFPPATLPRWTWYTHSFKPDSTLYGELATLYTTAPEIATIGALQGGSLIAAVQPISASAVLAGRESNNGTGNALGLQLVNQTWWTVTVSWWNAEDDAAVYVAGKSLANKIRAAADAAGASLDYIFMNDANIDQPVIASYGKANVRRLKAVQKAYDPDLIFQKLVTGGQKIP
ncbi:FAD-binding domain-containing protein [Xylariaceae sp. AK1471]|nr:FAD-binding domain-containing protein [Xylariaceae sp. AK1471]